MSDDLREYRRELALYCITRETRPVSAADLAETMGTLAMREGHPKACFARLDGVEVAGILRALRNTGHVRSAGAVHSSAQGREVPVWLKADGQERSPMPLPPDDEPAASRAPSPAAGALDDRTEAMLAVGDMTAAFYAQQRAEREAFEREQLRKHMEFTARARDTLVRAGVEVPTA
ncbi:hypothetical protein ABE488_09125 [Luteimonas sp. TWI662]|uniref:hypothetical protein n=1 Tax=Luteimonas sp. TWI662 TaxID=3136789 RepID=UPI0032085BE7